MERDREDWRGEAEQRVGIEQCDRRTVRAVKGLPELYDHWTNPEIATCPLIP